MSKIYDLYPSYERKIDNWRRRILGYEKMKRDLQRQIQILKNTNKKQKEVIDKAIELLGNYKHYSTPDEKQNADNEDLVNNAFDTLKEVSE